MLEMSQKSIKQTAEKMTEMYNKIWATEKENDDPNKEKGKLHKRKKIHCTKEDHQSQCIQSHNYANTESRWHAIYKNIFDLKENEEIRPPKWKTRV